MCIQTIEQQYKYEINTSIQYQYEVSIRILYKLVWNKNLYSAVEQRSQANAFRVSTHIQSATGVANT